MYYNHLQAAYLTFASPTVFVFVFVIHFFSVFNSPLFMSKYEWGDIFRRIDSSGQQDPVAKSDVEQWLSIVVCAKRNTIVRDYEIQEIHFPLTIFLVFSKRNKMAGD